MKYEDIELSHPVVGKRHPHQKFHWWPWKSRTYRINISWKTVFSFC